jgi:hypothetical protein
MSDRRGGVEFWRVVPGSKQWDYITKLSIQIKKYRLALSSQPDQKLVLTS